MSTEEGLYEPLFIKGGRLRFFLYSSVNENLIDLGQTKMMSQNGYSRRAIF
jgi:hypothetical protein